MNFYKIGVLAEPSALECRRKSFLVPASIHNPN
jgi:hypothetical protein